MWIYMYIYSVRIMERGGPQISDMPKLYITGVSMYSMYLQQFHHVAAGDQGWQIAKRHTDSLLQQNKVRTGTYITYNTCL